jgi:hypothetical protein
MQRMVFDQPNIKSRLFLRALTYSSSIAAVVFMLILCREFSLRTSFFLLSVTGLLLVMAESFFTVYYNHVNKSHHRIKEYNFLHHAVNHLVYPFAYYLGLVTYLYFEENILLSIALSFLAFLIYLINYYYLPRHIYLGHVDHPESAKVSARVDFVMYSLKFFSFFAVNLALFQANAQSVIPLNVIFLINFALIWLYLFFHINRKDDLSVLNILMAAVFGAITSLFIIYARTSVVNFSAAVATLIFYLASGIYYHKVDGTLDNRIVIEYASIAALVSVFIFSV